MYYTLYCDGSSRGNPGHSGVGSVLYKQDKLINCLSRYIGIATNNVAEYIGVIYGLDMCINLNIKNLIVYGDSTCVIEQSKNNRKVKTQHLLSLHQYVQRLSICFKYIDFQYIPREYNTIADQLAKDASYIGKHDHNVNHEYIYTAL